MKQKPFLRTVSVDEAKRIILSKIRIIRYSEEIEIQKALGRILSENVISKMDVPPFDRASMDGYAVVAADTFGADEENPKLLEKIGSIRAGEDLDVVVESGRCVEISTGAPMPAGADSVVIVEDTEEEGNFVRIYRSITPGKNVMPAGSDIMRGETILRKGTSLGPRETGVLAACGFSRINVYKKPKVAIISTGDEIIPPGEELTFGKIYDVNSRTISDAVRENGGEPVYLGIAPDDKKRLLERIKKALSGCDLLITSGGTSAGAGDLLYQIVEEQGELLIHGIAIKPGKPFIFGIFDEKPIFGLPGYPTSALITFNIFVSPIIREMAGYPPSERKKIKAKTSVRIYSARGRREYLPINLISGKDGYGVYPILSGSGAITTFSNADGYVEIPENVEILEEGTEVDVELLSESVKPADLCIIGSHCIGIDLILEMMMEKKRIKAKIMNVGSIAGLSAVKRGESDVSGTHLIDEETGDYNTFYLKKYRINACLVGGYEREQGIIVKKGNPKEISSLEDLFRVRFINRNPGSGTRTLLDIELKRIGRGGIRGIEAKTHSAVASAVFHGKADAGIGIRSVASMYDLDFIPLWKERYDFAIPVEKMDKESVKEFIQILNSERFKKKLEKIPGMKTTDKTGKIIYSPD
ncbi:MAG: molybdopterin biosynthesis protein [Candidatus Syntropharchaeia archaeon]